MSLTDTQIFDLAKRMKIPLVFCDFKTKLKSKKLQYNKTYIVNLEDEFDADGQRNDGSHYTAFQVNKYPNGKIERCYFDPFGAPAPQAVEEFVGGGHIPYNTKDIQSLMNSACGWYALGWSYWINCYEDRSRDLYTDCETFTDLFDDLSKGIDHKHNEFVLKHFFRSSDASKRKPVEVWAQGEGRIPADPETISSEDDDNKKHL